MDSGTIEKVHSAIDLKVKEIVETFYHTKLIMFEGINEAELYPITTLFKKLANNEVIKDEQLVDDCLNYISKKFIQLKN